MFVDQTLIVSFTFFSILFNILIFRISDASDRVETQNPMFFLHFLNFESLLLTIWFVITRNIQWACNGKLV